MVFIKWEMVCTKDVGMSPNCLANYNLVSCVPKILTVNNARLIILIQII